MKPLALYILAAAVLTTPAFAADGTTLINQASVLNSGGFPFNITQVGSYRLSSDLIVPCATAAGAINVTASNVTLDLNGFTISCSDSGNAATGILATGANTVTIMNGTITGFGGARRSLSSPIAGSGISCVAGVVPLSRCKVDHVNAVQNGTGISADALTDLVVTESTVSGNLANGVVANNTLRMTNSEANENALNGVVINVGVITGCHFIENGLGIQGAGSGILAAGSATLTNNAIFFNTADGIGVSANFAASGAVVGFGLNTIVGNGADVAAVTGLVSMKNNVSTTGGLF